MKKGGKKQNIVVWHFELPIGNNFFDLLRRSVTKWQQQWQKRG